MCFDSWGEMDRHNPPPVCPTINVWENMFLTLKYSFFFSGSHTALSLTQFVLLVLWLAEGLAPSFIPPRNNLIDLGYILIVGQGVGNQINQSRLDAAGKLT